LLQKIFLGLFIALVLTACGSGKELYMESRESKPLEVPNDLDMPNRDGALFIPGRYAPELAGRAQARPPLVLSSEEAELANTNIRYGDGALYLLVEDEPASVWRRLGFTLNRAGMTVNVREQDQQRYRFSYVQPPLLYTDRSFWDTIFFWRNSDPIDYSGSYQVELKGDDNNPDNTRVYLYDADLRPADPEASDHLLGIIQKRLG
jgi:uncharacterized lipoprotein